jgi:hypothetical protein
MRYTELCVCAHRQCMKEIPTSQGGWVLLLVKHSLRLKRKAIPRVQGGCVEANSVSVRHAPRVQCLLTVPCRAHCWFITQSAVSK